MSLGWEAEPQLHDGSLVISNAISEVLGRQNQMVLFFAATSNDGSRSHDFYPANHKHVFSIRATNADGRHQGPNAALPESGEAVFGTLGNEVPTASIRKTAQETPRSGSSPATAIAAGLAAVLIGYITVNERHQNWKNIRTHRGFEQLLYKVTKAPDERKRFFTLENFYAKSRWPSLDAHLNIACGE